MGVDGHTLLQRGLAPGPGLVGHGRRVVLQPSAAGPHHRPDGQAEGHGELEVALVVGGHGHDGAAAVAGQDVVGDDHRQRLAGGRVGRVAAGEHRRLGPLGLALAVAQGGGPPPVGGHGLDRRRRLVPPGRRRARRPGRGRQLVHQRVLGGQDQAGGAEDRVRPGGVDHDLGAAAGRGRGGEADVGALAAADPVALLGLERVGPVEGVQVLEQPVGVGGDPQHPLAHPAAVHGIVPDGRAALGGHLLVGQDRPQPRAPVDRRLVEVGEAVGVDGPAPLDRVQLGPRPAAGGCPHALLELLDQGVDGPGRPPAGVEPGPEQLQEDPLGPAVVARVGGGELAARVVAQPEPAELAPHGVDVLGGGDRRVPARLDGVLLGGQAEGVEPEGMQDVVAPHAPEAGVGVGGDVAERVADVEAGARGVGEHVEHVAPVAAVRAGRVGDLEGPPFGPPPLPARLDLAGQLGGVAVRRGRRGARGLGGHEATVVPVSGR